MSAINEEYTKMSLHNHSGGDGADCKIDHKIGRASTFDLTQGHQSTESVVANGFELIVQSNSNCLHPAEYLLMRQYAKMRRVELLPRVEVNPHNWEHQDKILHMLVFAPPAVHEQRAVTLVGHDIQQQGDIRLFAALS